MSDHFSMRMELLDQQLVDSDRLPFGRVDDLELELHDAEPRVAAILTGAQALGERLGRAPGRWMARTASRLRVQSAPEGPAQIDIDLIEDTEPLIRLRVTLSELPGVAGLERWLAKRAIEPLPGAGDAVE